jgi:hypothetical protein
MPVGGPKISRATPGDRYAADIEQPLFWHTHQPVEASAAAIASVTVANDTGRNSAPPIERGCSMRKNRPSISFCNNHGGSSRRCSTSSDALAISGASARMRAIKSVSSLVCASITSALPTRA